MHATIVVCIASVCKLTKIFLLQAFHSAQEVMASDHVEIHLQPAASIVSKCKIHTLEQYMVNLKSFRACQIMSNTHGLL